jgi:tetratricopeptide (TPR) repeat protein
MQDFYEVLGIDKSASQAQIKAAYKRMAMRYHPDHNPENKQAEETFKLVNEAYHTLSDPEKKLRYDSRFYWVTETPDEAYWQEIKRKRFEQWKRNQDRDYRLDRNYFKIQGLAFLVFLIMAGFCFGIMNTAKYYVDRKHQQKYNANSQLLKQVNGLFGEDRFDDAFSMISVLEEKDPLEYRFIFARDSLVSALRQRADGEFRQNNFSEAVKHYVVLQNYEHPVRFETLENISRCQYYLGNYKESLQAIKHLHNQQPNNLNLIYQIAHINLQELENPEEALQYFTLGKKLFKENLGKVYGKAFEIVMDPADAPDIYFHIFNGRAIANLQLKNYKEAITDCNWAILLRPKLGQPYYHRALANIRNGSTRYICEDLQHAVEYGVSEAEPLQKKHCNFAKVSVSQ